MVNLSRKKVCEIACCSTYHLFDQYDRRKVSSNTNFGHIKVQNFSIEDAKRTQNRPDNVQTGKMQRLRRHAPCVVTLHGSFDAKETTGLHLSGTCKREDSLYCPWIVTDTEIQITTKTTQWMLSSQ